MPTRPQLITSPRWTVSEPKVKCGAKKTRFHESVLVYYVDERSSQMPPQIKSQAYYSKEELRGFESEGLEMRSRVILQARSLAKSNNAFSPAEHVSTILESDSCFRGFEARLCPRRTRKRAMTQAALLKCQKQLRGLESSLTIHQRDVLLAKSYASISQWSKDLALRTARRDEEQVQQFKVQFRSSNTAISSSSAAHSDLKRSIYFHTEGIFDKKQKVLA